VIADVRQRATGWVDWLTVLALTGFALVDVWTSPFTGVRSVNTLLFLSVCLTLLWRRRAPLMVLLVAMAVLIIQANFFDPQSQPPFSSFVILLVAFYSLAVYGEQRRAIIGGAFAFAAEIPSIDLPRFLAGESPITSSPRGSSSVHSGSPAGRYASAGCRRSGSRIWPPNSSASARRTREGP
jgi:hypothetical protein